MSTEINPFDILPEDINAIPIRKVISAIFTLDMSTKNERQVTIMGGRTFGDILEKAFKEELTNPSLRK